MTAVEQLITDNLDIWSSAVKAKSSAGRGTSKKIELYGIKKLRELILELAVRGLLVPQDPNDESAVELLQRIKKRKDKLIKDGQIKKQAHLPPVTEEEKPFDLPDGWGLERIGNLTEKLGSGSTPRGGKNAYVADGIPFLRSQNVWNEGLKLDDIAYITQEMHEKMDNTKVYPNDILLNITGASLGRSIIFPPELAEANVSQHVTIIRLVEPDMARFVNLGILSPMIQRLVWGRQVGMAIEGLSKKVLEMFEFPIPPLAEQRRIVAKVDELMTLCDQLEQQQESSISAHQTLVKTLLSALTTACEREDFAAAWARIAEHFDTLFTTEWSIDQLKQTILQLAVMGKLVPQDPNDEPASELLKKIAAEKAKLIKEGKIKKQKPLPPISDDEKPFELPEGWEVIRFGKLVNLVSGQHLKPNEYFEMPQEGMIPYLTGPAEFGERYPAASRYTLERRSLAQEGDLLITCKGSGVGKLNEANREIFISRQLMAIQPIVVNASYVKLLAASLNRYLKDRAVGIAIPGISREDVNEALICLPPEEEQNRIVALVEELTSVCDALSNSISTAQATQFDLVDVIGNKMIGYQANRDTVAPKNGGPMKILTQLTLGSVPADNTAILAKLVESENGSADAKLIWSRSKLDLPEFYKQLKIEIEAGYLTKPNQAEIEG